VSEVPDAERTALENLRKQTRDCESALFSWLTELDGYVKRTEARERLNAYRRGLLDDVKRRNSGQLAEHQGDAHTYSFQHRINRSRWNDDNVRYALQGSARR